jgi:arginine decarboxylase
MGTIRIVWGTATGPTPMASYDAALADANLHEYNLVSVSSVVPATATIEAVGTAPELGPTGDRLAVVEGCRTVTADESGPAVATLAWARGPDGSGVFYEAGGTEPDAVVDRVETGLEAGCELREWAVTERGRRTASIPARPDAPVTAVVLAVYGESGPLL